MCAARKPYPSNARARLDYYLLLNPEAIAGRVQLSIERHTVATKEGESGVGSRSVNWSRGINSGRESGCQQESGVGSRGIDWSRGINSSRESGCVGSRESGVSTSGVGLSTGVGVSINNTPQSLLSSPNLHPLSAHSITTQQNTTSSLPKPGWTTHELANSYRPIALIDGRVHDSFTPGQRALLEMGVSWVRFPVWPFLSLPTIETISKVRPAIIAEDFIHECGFHNLLPYHQLIWRPIRSLNKWQSSLHRIAHQNGLEGRFSGLSTPARSSSSVSLVCATTES